RRARPGRSRTASSVTLSNLQTNDFRAIECERMAEVHGAARKVSGDDPRHDRLTLRFNEVGWLDLEVVLRDRFVHPRADGVEPLVPLFFVRYHGYLREGCDHGGNVACVRCSKVGGDRLR